ncbi:OLC1v1029880C2 [Oldenlandia corymbosa var. corymbosa]|uniref:OLC1v1029880C2 n=1 Tax=Oldenlandia corymbosa var. corymbosa TaxID=529605 RepID=A0AAV1CI42_OLDCO|nr:OLC1v1029880C2 [Oldenlandia corymbosa var. corymbosa]
MVFPFMKNKSKKTVCCPEDQYHHQHHQNDGESTSPHEEVTVLTVWRKSLLLSCEGFTVIGSDGNLVFRVDNYAGRYRRPSQVVLMDGKGMPLLTLLRRKKFGLVDNWLVFEGEIEDCSDKIMSSKKPIYIVKKNYVLHSNFGVLAYVYRGMSEKRHSYVIEGSYAIRSCKVYDESRRVVAEIKKKESSTGGVSRSFGLEVFQLVVHPGFDSGFAMALILLLDQMFT